MTTLLQAVAEILRAQQHTRKPLAIVVAGHNGSGKSTMWRDTLSPALQMPLINADRMMLSILPEADSDGYLTGWAAALRDTDSGWMGVAQRGVQAFVGQAMGAKLPFAMETVFSHWETRPDGSVASKIDMIRDMQAAGYFVLLFFVGLINADLSVFRVQTRVRAGGHGITEPTLRKRFPKTQHAISQALAVADASILVDNSRGPDDAFTVCRVQLNARPLFDVRQTADPLSSMVSQWMDRVSPPPP